MPEKSSILTPHPASGPLLVLTAAVLWGTTGTAQALAPAGASPLAVGAMRLVIGGSALLLLALVRDAFRAGRAWPPVATAVAASSMALYQLCFFAGVARTGIAVGTLVAIGSGPVIAGLLAMLFLDERPTRRWLPATALAVSGCTLLVLSGAGTAAVQVDGLGVLLAVGAGGCYAAYTIASKRLLDVQPPDAVTAAAFFGGALLLLPLLFVVDLSWLAESRGLIAALHLGLIATALAYWCYIRGLASIPAAAAVTLALVEPLTAALLGVLVVGERLSGPALLGMALIVSGLGVLVRGRRK